MFDVGSVSRREAVQQVLGRIALRRKPVVVFSSHVQVKLAFPVEWRHAGIVPGMP